MDAQLNNEVKSWMRYISTALPDQERREALLAAERKHLLTLYRKAAKMRYEGYRVAYIAEYLGITIEDVKELAREVPC